MGKKLIYIVLIILIASCSSKSKKNQNIISSEMPIEIKTSYQKLEQTVLEKNDSLRGVLKAEDFPLIEIGIDKSKLFISIPKYWEKHEHESVELAVSKDCQYQFCPVFSVTKDSINIEKEEYIQANYTQLQSYLSNFEFLNEGWLEMSKGLKAYFVDYLFYDEETSLYGFTAFVFHKEKVYTFTGFSYGEEKSVYMLYEEYFSEILKTSRIGSVPH